MPIELFCFKGTVIERGNPFTFFLQFKWPSNLNKLPFYIPVESFTGKKFHKIASSIAAAYFIQLSLKQLENILLKELLKYGYCSCPSSTQMFNLSKKIQLPTVEKKKNYFCKCFSFVSCISLCRCNELFLIAGSFIFPTAQPPLCEQIGGARF